MAIRHFPHRGSLVVPTEVIVSSLLQALHLDLMPKELTWGNLSALLLTGIRENASLECDQVVLASSLTCDGMPLMVKGAGGVETTAGL